MTELVPNEPKYWEFIRHPDFQKRGIGKFMINELMARHPQSVAKVKIENEASLRLFESAGFKKKYYILEKD